MELEEHFQPQEPPESASSDLSEAGDGPDWVDAYEC
jgi:hypothetical protein